MADEQYAFRCANCGRLAGADEAGPNRAVPARCRSCGKGAHLTDAGVTEYDSDNWIVLADLHKDALAEILDYHAIKKSDIARHSPDAVEPAPAGAHVTAEASDTTTSEDHA